MNKTVAHITFFFPRNGTFIRIWVTGGFPHTRLCVKMNNFLIMLQKLKTSSSTILLAFKVFPIVSISDQREDRKYLFGDCFITVLCGLKETNFNQKLGVSTLSKETVAGHTFLSNGGLSHLPMHWFITSAQQSYF